MKTLRSYMYGQTFFLSFLLLEEVRKGPYFTNSITPGTNQTQTNIQRRGVQNLLLGNMSPPQAENKCSPFFKNYRSVHTLRYMAEAKSRRWYMLQEKERYRCVYIHRCMWKYIVTCLLCWQAVPQRQTFPNLLPYTSSLTANTRTSISRNKMLVYFYFYSFKNN